MTTPDLGGFDRYCDEHGISPTEAPAAFAAYLHEISGGAWDGEVERVIGGRDACILAIVTPPIRRRRRATHRRDVLDVLLFLGLVARVSVVLW